MEIVAEDGDDWKCTDLEQVTNGDLEAQKRLSYRQSRGWTIWHGLKKAQVDVADGSLVIDLIGADYVEAHDMDMFTPMLRKLASSFPKLKTVELLLIGPNIPMDVHGKEFNMNVIDHTQVQVTIKCVNCAYHEFPDRANNSPDMAFLFNAGIWGYDSWVPTLEHLFRLKTRVVVTSYNRWEAEDDEDVIQNVSKSWKFLWQPMENGFRSLQTRESGIESRLCADNHYWQCFVNQNLD